jgi:hypothetical protein
MLTAWLQGLLEKALLLQPAVNIVNISTSAIINFIIESKRIDRELNMTNWIPFSEGEYIVDQAFIIAPDDRAVSIENAVIEVYSVSGGERQLTGSGRLRNILLVNLLEDHDDLELLLDLGDEFKYRLIKPELRSGKFFSPDAKSTLQFRPSEPWVPIAQADFEKLVSRLTILDA